MLACSTAVLGLAGSIRDSLQMVSLPVQVLSNGDARIAAKGGHTGASSTVYHNQGSFGSTLYNDPDLQTIGADGSGRNM